MGKTFGPDGVLASHLPGYESRPGQQEMAEAVADLLELPDEEPFIEIDQAACLVAEAETGLGKTLAYLVPAVLSGRKVVVSTNTRNLQDQILQREIPFIRQYIDPELKALCVKGRQNYLCLYRWQQYRTAGQAKLFNDESAEKIDHWLTETTFADRAELKWLAGNSLLWQKICCLSHFCLGSDCPDTTGCFLNRLRREAASCRLLVVNHHLLFSDLAVRRGGYGEVLPRYEAVIFDEAHHVENVASTFFGYTCSRYQVLDLAGDVERSAQAELTDTRQQEVLQTARGLSGAIEQFVALFPTERGRFPLHELMRKQPELNTGRDNLSAAFDRLAKSLDGLGGREEPWEQYDQRCLDLGSRLESITAESFDDSPEEDLRYIHWFERTEKNLTLSATPIDISEELQETLFSKVACCVFTSATLTTAGDFGYFFKRLGLPENTQTLSFPSPFNYKEQTLLYIPNKKFPEPASPGYQQAIHDQMEQLIKLAQGRALVLFTSLAAMDAAFHALQDVLDYPMLRQGTASRHSLLSRFTRETRSVLFAVASFWEGVDIPGESLSLVIIDKLPFEVPSDPVIMARINRIKAKGGNPFFEFQVPRAILGLRQGVGRLMRSAADRGVMAVLDVRLFTRGYGRRFLQSLPPSPVSRDINQVKHFFHE